MWQALRVYTDVWLRDWTDYDGDDDGAVDVCRTLNPYNLNLCFKAFNRKSWVVEREREEGGGIRKTFILLKTI